MKKPLFPYILILTAAFSLLAMVSSEEKDIQPTASDFIKTEWLIGTWEHKTSKGSSFESWVKINDKELAGKSYALDGKDTQVFETIQLVEKDETLFYIPTVNNQNKGLPVSFLLKSISEEKMVFENPKHGFPQVISYTRLSADSLVAEISGSRNGMNTFRVFPMRRVR